MSELTKTVKFYETLAGLPLDQDISLPAAGVHVVAVGGFLIVALDPKLLNADRREMAAETPVTMIFADVDAAVRRAVSLGAEIVQARWVVPHGAGYRMCHADGMIVEYLEHRPSEYDTNAPSQMFTTYLPLGAAKAEGSGGGTSSAARNLGECWPLEQREECKGGNEAVTHHQL